MRTTPEELVVELLVIPDSMNVLVGRPWCSHWSGPPPKVQRATAFSASLQVSAAQHVESGRLVAYTVLTKAAAAQSVFS